MIRLTGKHPCNTEAPLSTLFSRGFLTPQNLFYVRSHGYTPRVTCPQAKAWRLRVHGLVDNGNEFSIQDLKERFQVITLPVTLVCAGNRRKEQNMVAKGLGFNWGAAGVSTGLFTGVYLADILDYCKPKSRARHVIFEGADELPQGKYGTSQRLSWALDRKKGMLVSWGLNGEDLSPDHGYPLRLVVPGQIGGRMVKWLQSIEVSDRESQHHLHFFDNKLLPTEVTAEQARTEDKWWYDPKYIINELNVNAAICSPEHNQLLQLALEPETLPIQGYAYTGGGRRITRVEVTFDDGQTWKLADITYPEDLYRIHPVQDHHYFGKIDLSMTEMSFSWCFWKLNVNVQSCLINRDVNAIAVRAMDEALSVMPRDMYWNATSMMNSWWFRVAVHKEVDGRCLRFEHPTVAGNASGGWMQRMKDSAKEDAASNIITASELAQHADGQGPTCWFVIQNHVYDATGFLQDHPGGDQSIRLVAGEDVTEDFMAIHSMDARKMLRQFHIGKLEDEAAREKASCLDVEARDDASKPFLEPRRWKKARLVCKKPASHDSRIFRFALSHDEQKLGLPVGQHVFLRAKKINDAAGEGEMMQRAYTPYSDNNQRGFLDILIKVYFPSRGSTKAGATFPGGKMTMLLENTRIDGGLDELTVEIKGPVGHFTYLGDGQVQWGPGNRIRKVRRLAMIAGGSGITPIWSTLRAIADEYMACPPSKRRQPMQVWLVYGNRTERDILIREELDRLLYSLEGNLCIWHVLSSDEHSSSSWKMGRGHINVECLRRHLPPPPSMGAGDEIGDTLALVCGPPPMEKAVGAGLQELGWVLDRDVVFF
ncbi:oxidoreductase molybdopterin binding domain-containing protein [Hirsutella rhossiliensis]|uniref:Nitrate reductase [NADPH] n=1 Tax=Hirsutella rhossiliensis TaxID=111463 RepID=A0A9P8SJM9_9HYPO|nr:oxidoreductase molybdopterin binding domain-containing protein [Hirsutella rhossiliensis]KAH0963890.1 oxidoreductase molybdopterin binding domain-containing protein [Hirsutella rhossiliensis]